MPQGECQCRIKVHLRMRPSSKPSAALHFDETKAMVRIDVQKKQSNVGGPPRSYTDQIVFSLDSVIQTTNQETVFDSCAKQLVEDVLQGYHGTIMTYGQVGSGKTFTMTGDMKVYAHRGIAPRAMHRIFQEKETKPEAGIRVQMSYVEVYNEGIYDLLQTRGEPAGSLMILEENGLVELRGLTKMPVENEAEALKLYFEGEKLRSYSDHSLNQMSSRSHCVLTLYIERRTGIRTLQDVTVAKLNLVDLAGNERVKKTSDYRGRLRREAMAINKSLTFLEQTVYALRLGQGYIPFRQSRLTTLLKESLGGNCKTILIVCAWPEDYFLDETIGSLRFAQRVKLLRTTAIINKKLDSAGTERRYAKEIIELRQELALKDALSGHTRISYDELTEEAKTELRNKIEAFITDEKELDQIPVENFRQVKELLCLFKEAHVSIRTQVFCPSPKGNSNQALNNASGINKLRTLVCLELVMQSHIMENPDCCDSTVSATSTKGELIHWITWGGTQLEKVLAEYGLLPPPEEPPPEDSGVEGVWECSSDIRNDAFLEFKNGTEEGQQQEAIIKSKEGELQIKRRHARDICATINEAKKEIQGVKGWIYVGVNRLRSLKSAYHKAYDELKTVKVDLEAVQQEVRDGKEMLLESFYGWFHTLAKYRGQETEDFLASVA
ncbi:hypothetical protein CY35_18G024400 [Sphagnum magellanicum]|nr:hypothetical protein CY35_18G024400 [Sphagnum magellanicum]